MSQPVRPHGWQTSAEAGSLDDVTDQVRPDRSSWRPADQEQPSRVLGDAAPGQVGDQRLADLRRKREPVLATALAADDKLTGPPVDISQFQPCDLDRTQLKSRDERRPEGGGRGQQPALAPLSALRGVYAASGTSPGSGGPFGAALVTGGRSS